MTAAAQPRRFTDDRRADVLVAVVVVAALLGAYFYRLSLSGQTIRFEDPGSGFALSVPDGWTITTTEAADTFVSARNPHADSVYKSTVVGQSFLLDPDNPATLDTIVDRIIQRRGEELLGYHLMDDQPTIVGGAEARRIDYAYVTQPIDDPFMASPPVVVLATDYIIHTPAEYWILTLAADEKIADKERAGFDNILESVALPPPG